MRRLIQDMRSGLAKALSQSMPGGESEATQLHRKVAELSAKGQYDQALERAEQALLISEKDSRNKLEKIAVALNNIGLLCWAKGEYDQVDLLYQQALAINRLETVDHEVATTLDNLGQLSRAKGDYATAETYLRQALEQKERLRDAQSESIAITLNHLALLFLDKGNYPPAEHSLKRALDIYRRMSPSNNDGLAATLNNLAALYRAKGEYDKAESSLKEALEIDQQALKAGHPEVAATLNNLAELYHDKGDYLEAEQSYQKAREIWEQALGTEHPRVAAALNNLAVLHQDKGDYKRAQSHLEQALALSTKAQGDVHPQVATILHNLGGLYRAQGNLTCAGQLYQQARGIWERTLGPEHPRVAIVLNSLAGIYRVQGKDAEAISGLQRVLAYREKALGPKHPDVATTLNNLAELSRMSRAYNQAEEHYTRALALKEDALGANHPHVATILHNLAILYQAIGKMDKAVDLTVRSTNIQEHNLTLILTTGSEEQKRAYTDTLAGETSSTVSLHTRFAPQSAKARDLAVTTVLRRKGRVLEAMTDSIAILQGRLDPEAQRSFKEWTSERERLARMVLQGPRAMSLPEYREQLGKLEIQIQQLEAKISSLSAPFRAQVQSVTLDRVRQALPRQAALVEIVVYRPFNPAAQEPAAKFGAARYAAYVLHSETEPAWVDLGEAASIDGMVKRLRQQIYDDVQTKLKKQERSFSEWVTGFFHRFMGDRTQTEVRQFARELDEQVMRPIRRLIGDPHLVLISPDGALNLVPFGALVDERQRYLLERFSFTYLTSGRDLLRLEIQATSKSDPVIIADPAYNLYGRSASKPIWKSLPHTMQEAEKLKTLLPEATVLTWGDATEEALKSVSGPRILHVATHGFFLPDPSAMKNDGHERLKPGSSDELEEGGVSHPFANQVENPLLRSALVLAGANSSITDKQDGIATAFELSGLDLWGTELVVLSACETGVGDVQSGEGVYGLRRALVLAGAESQVISLWRGDDAATQDLMVTYYKRLMDSEGRSEALRRAQLEMLQSRDRSHPFYWANFIHVGQWGSLHGGIGRGKPSRADGQENAQKGKL